jgi:hypothetical protein
VSVRNVHSGYPILIELLILAWFPPSVGLSDDKVSCLGFPYLFKISVFKISVL